MKKLIIALIVLGFTVIMSCNNGGGGCDGCDGTGSSYDSTHK
jgi:predicted small secreted protein